MHSLSNVEGLFVNAEGKAGGRDAMKAGYALLGQKLIIGAHQGQKSRNSFS